MHAQVVDQLDRARAAAIQAELAELNAQKYPTLEDVERKEELEHIASLPRQVRVRAGKVWLQGQVARGHALCDAHAYYTLCAVYLPPPCPCLAQISRQVSQAARRQALHEAVNRADPAIFKQPSQVG